MQVGAHHAGIDGVDPDAVFGPLDGGAAGQVVQGGLRHAVGREVGKGAQAGDARDVDDGPAPLLNCPRAGWAAAMRFPLAI